MLVEQIVHGRGQDTARFPAAPADPSAPRIVTGLLQRLNDQAELTITEPLGYIQFMNLVCPAPHWRLPIPAALQEETTYLNIPCLTLRPNTERPVTISEGTNRLVQTRRSARPGRKGTGR